MNRGPAPATVAAAALVGALCAGPARADAVPAPSASASAATPPADTRVATGVDAAVRQPRGFGHVVGDLLTQRISLELAAGAVPPAALPPAERVGLYLERRAPHVERDGLGRRWLVLSYQVINAPRALTATALPALSIATGGATVLKVPAWPVSIGPLTPPVPVGQGELLPMRPDRLVEPLPTAGIVRQLRASLLALAAVSLAWAAWWAWRNAREARRLPFARAWHRLRRLDDDSPEAWLSLHRALDATAGRVVHGTTLDRLLAQAPHLRPEQARLEAFFRRSGERFFVPTSDGRTGPSFPLRELARALRAIERRQHA